jgi:hypothetical protein
MGEFRSSFPARQLRLSVRRSGFDKFEGSVLWRLADFRKKYSAMIGTAEKPQELKALVDNFAFPLSPGLGHPQSFSGCTHEILPHYFMRPLARNRAKSKKKRTPAIFRLPSRRRNGQSGLVGSSETVPWGKVETSN